VIETTGPISVQRLSHEQTGGGSYDLYRSIIGGTKARTLLGLHLPFVPIFCLSGSRTEPRETARLESRVEQAIVKSNVSKRAKRGAPLVHAKGMCSVGWLRVRAHEVTTLLKSKKRSCFHWLIALLAWGPK
jgi:hypothetical protein